MAAAECERLTGALVLFGRELRARGVVVGSGQLVRFEKAVALLDATDLRDLYWAGRASLLTSAIDVPAYDEVFAEVFLGSQPPHVAPSERNADQEDDSLAPPSDGEERREPRERETPPGEDGDEDTDPAPVGAVASTAEVLRHKAFAECTPEEQAQITELLRRLRLSVPPRTSRRTRAGQPAHRLDLRRTVRRSLRTHGELIRRDWKRRRQRPRNLVLMLDVSGSMTGYSRALLQFGHSLSMAGARVEVFCFGTRLTRVTESLQATDPDTAMGQAADAVVDWDGGTRIGYSLRQLLRGWGGTSFLRGSVVIICSDGLERGDPSQLGSQMARLSRIAHRVIWVNPLKGDPGYEPATRGMSVSLPYIDHLVAGDTLASLEGLATLLRHLDAPRREPRPRAAFSFIK